MAIYSDLLKLGRVQIPSASNPSGSVYALIDVDGRAFIAPNFSSSATYLQGDYVVVTGLTGDNTQYNDSLYRSKSAISTAGAFDPNDWEQVTVGSELKRIEEIVAGGIHYRGKTSTAIYDGSTTNPITINGSSYTAESGDLVILSLSSVASAYAVSTAYSAHQYISNNGKYYIVTSAITAEENTSFSAIESKLDLVSTDPEFLYDGSVWNSLGSIGDGLGALAWKDSASGIYVKPTGSGSVTIKTYSETSQHLEVTTIVGTNGTVNASEVTGGTSKNQWKQDTTNPTFVYGTADVDTAVTYGNANVGSAVTGVAKLDSTQKSFTTTWSSSNTTGAVTASVTPGTDMLVISAANTGNIYGVQSSGVDITPAVASTSTLTPAKAADTSRTAINLVADGTLTGSYTITARTPAAVASGSTTVATGQLTTNTSGAEVVTGVTEGTESATVTVGTTTDTVTVR